MSFDNLQLRNALGRFATGVCIVTANPPGQVPFGVTINSFASVSLTPPLVLWCLQKSSHTVDAFHLAGHYCVNVLSHNQRPLASRFAKAGEHALDNSLYTLGETGLPVMHGCLAAFECDIEGHHDGGDHIILIGRVRELRAEPSGHPLLFYAGGYREMS